MALILSMRKGEDFFVGDELFVIGDVRGPTKFDVLHKTFCKIGVLKIPRTIKHAITDAHGVQVLEHVFVSAGINETGGMIRIAIEAPYDVLILRGDKKRNPPPHIAAKMQV